jgi:hypothetical protein
VKQHSTRAAGALKRGFVRSLAAVTVLTVCAAFTVAPAGAESDSVGSPVLSINSLSPSATNVTYTVTFTATDGLTQNFSSIVLAAGAGTRFVGSSGGYICGTYDIYDETSGQADNCMTPTLSNSGATVSLVPNSPNVSEGDQVTVVAMGVANDSSTSAQTLKVSTTSDPSAVTLPYTLDSTGKISAPTYSQSTYAVSTANVTDTASFVATDGVSQGFSTITLAAPSGTQFVGSNSGYICGTYYFYDITTGQGSNCMTPTTSNGGATVSLVPNAPNVNPGDEVTIVATDVTNAPAAGTLDISTSADPTPQAVSTTAATAGPVSLQLSSYTPSATETTYQVNFATSHGLTGGSSTITLTAPGGTTFGASSGCFFSVWNDNGDANSCATVAGGGGTDSVTLTVPATVPAGGEVTIVAAGVTNDSSTAGQGISVSDSTDGTVGSASYTLNSSGAVSGVDLQDNTLTKSATDATYVATFVATDAVSDGDSIGLSSITLSAPAGTLFPASTDDYAIWDDTNASEAGPSSVSLSNGDATATIFNSTNLPRGHVVTIVVSGVKNDATATAQSFKVSTTSDPVAGSTSYTLSSTGEDTGASLGLTSHAEGATGVTYTVNFNSTDGLTSRMSTVKLAASTGTMFGGGSGGYVCGYFNFYDDTTGQNAGCLTVTPSQANKTVTITVPVPVNAGDEVTIVAEGVKNASTATDSLALSTTSDKKAVKVAYTLR